MQIKYRGKIKQPFNKFIAKLNISDNAVAYFETERILYRKFKAVRKLALYRKNEAV